jgi:hypothetical protein
VVFDFSSNAGLVTQVLLDCSIPFSECLSFPAPSLPYAQHLGTEQNGYHQPIVGADAPVQRGSDPFFSGNSHHSELQAGLSFTHCQDIEGSNLGAVSQSNSTVSGAGLANRLTTTSFSEEHSIFSPKLRTGYDGQPPDERASIGECTRLLALANAAADVSRAKVKTVCTW